MRASRYEVKPPQVRVRSPRKSIQIQGTILKIPDDSVLFLRTVIPPAILERMPKWFSIAYTDGMRQAADELEKTRLALAMLQNESTESGERDLAVLILGEEYHDLLSVLDQQRHLPEDERTISSDLILAIDKVRKHLTRKVIPQPITGGENGDVQANHTGVV